MSGKGIRLLGATAITALALGGGVLGMGLVSGPVTSWLHPDTDPTQAATATTGMDAALRAALAGTVDAATSRRPWHVEYDAVALPLAVANQRGSNWCWAATAAAVAGYYGVSVTQCALVEAGSPAGAVLGGCPDVPATPGQQAAALTAAGIPAVTLDRPLTQAELTAQIDAGLPVLAHLAAVEGSIGHVVLVRGYDAAGGLLLADPRPDRRDASLAWHSLPSSGVPFATLTTAAAASSDLVLTGQGSDGTDLYREQASWTATVLVAPPGAAPSLSPDPVPARDAEQDVTATAAVTRPAPTEAPTAAAQGGRAV